MRSVVLAGKEVSIKTYDDLYGLRLAMARGSRFNYPLDTDAELEKTLTDQSILQGKHIFGQ